MTKRWTGDWDAPKVSKPSGLPFVRYVIHLTAQGSASFEGVYGLDGKALARDGSFLVVVTPHSTAYSGQGQRRTYVPVAEHLYLIEGVVESRDGLDVLIASRLMHWSPRGGGE